MHWWILRRFPVQSGMFCCGGRSKGDDGLRKSEDNKGTPTPCPKRRQIDISLGSNRLKDKPEQETNPDEIQDEPDISLLQQAEPWSAKTIELLPIAGNDSSVLTGTVLDHVPISDRPQEGSFLPKSEPLKHQKNFGHNPEFLKTVDDSLNKGKQPYVILSTAEFDTKKNNSRINAESRFKESVAKPGQQEQLLRDHSPHPCLQASEQRIKYHHETTEQPRLHITQQYQLQFQKNHLESNRIQYQAENNQQNIYQQPNYQQQHHHNQQQQQDNQYLNLQQPHISSKTLSVSSTSNKTQQQHYHQHYYQNYHQQRFPNYQFQNQQQNQLQQYQLQQNQLQQNQQQQNQQQQNQLQQNQLKQNQLQQNQPQQNQLQQNQKQNLYQQQSQKASQNQQILHSKRHEKTIASKPIQNRVNVHRGREFSGGHSRPVSKNCSALEPEATALSLTGNHKSSRNVYANVQISSGGTNIVGPDGLEMGIKSMEVENECFVVETVEIIKRPGQTLGFYIREGNGFDRSDGVFISRIQMGTVAQTNGLLHVGDEIITVNNVKVSSMSLDDVVILMSIPKKLVLAIRTRRNNGKNKSCPVLPMVDIEEPPVVVLKKCRSSSASALEMTEKCPDLYEPGQSYSQFPLQSADYLPRRELVQSASRYASIHINPHRAEAKLLSEAGLESCTSSDGSLSRSIESSKERLYKGQDSMNAPHTGYMSVTNPIYDQFTSLDYKHYLKPESTRTLPKSPSKQNPLSVATQMHGYRGWPGTDTSPAYSEPSYINVSALRNSLMQQHSHPHYQLHQTSSIYSNLHPQQQHLTSSSHHYHHRSPSHLPTHQLQTSPHGTSYALSSHQYRGEIPLTAEERRRQEGFRTILNPKTKYGRFMRSRSPESYNSDSELIFTHQQQVDARGFASDYETYGGTISDDEPVYSIPRVPSSSSSELELLLKKFSTLSQELQQEQNKLQRQLSTRDKASRTGPLSLSRAESLSGDEYGNQSLSSQASPVPIRRAACTQTPVSTPRLIRHTSADASPYLYSAFQHDSLSDLSGRSTLGTPALATGGTLPLSIGGSLPLSTCQTSTQLTKQAESSSISPKHSPGRQRDLQLTRKPLHIPYSEFEPYKIDMKKRMDLIRAGGLDGVLSIHIMSGQGFKSSKTSLRDLYCVVAVDTLNKARTMIRTGAINFDWDEAFDIDLENSKEASFLIYHWDANFKHKLCFHGSVILPGYVQSGKRRFLAIKLEPKGILFVTLLYKEPAISLQRLPSMKKNATFGADLETIILRENSGLNVPFLVHKCVQEVERRGLETVGIYRLCGSTRRKVILREAFEYNAQAVDLSPENVSDIHVITGVLKDFLRELPEPLFTNALYQMLLDALSVRLPCDPEGSAKLMLSILECLPSVNQDTMALLLNHLRRVASHSDKNKMPIENLAICFGPVLLCPAPSSTPDPLLDFKKHIEVLKYLLEIWDYKGNTGIKTNKSHSGDSGGYLETDNPLQQSSHLLLQQAGLGSRRSSRDESDKFSSGDISMSLPTSPRQ